MEKYVNKIFYMLISEKVLPENIFPLTSRAWEIGSLSYQNFKRET